MPTLQVDPSSDESLQDVANALFKARKVVVVTGAGISTNSGIPDFRSENGLYSLIQAQFDAVARQNTQQDTSSPSDSDTESNEGGRAFKRRRISRESTIEVTLENTVGPSLPASDDMTPSTPKPSRSTVLTAIPTSPLSSPPVEIVPPSVFRNSGTRLFDGPVPPSSSPLSSPPPVLFDPWGPTSPSDTSPSRRSSTSPSEVDDTFNSVSFSASQTSATGRSSLPNMKGKDLFDASIWADPLRTSVFYTFATSLRQKVRDCEPTSSHRFISHLKDRGKLVRCYTQNIDRIEEKVGLSTSLQDGPGSRGRFSRKSTNASQLAKMVEEDSKDKPGSEGSENGNAGSSQSTTGPDGTATTAGDDETTGNERKPSKQPPQLERSRSSGVECVFLHGSLESLRCFLCGRVSSWDDNLEFETLSGQQPECPHCIGATAARQERGKRALGVGKLRPDIVLYGEEHPNAHLISPIVTHDLGLCPDMLLILGTSLRVHGLKVLVREFAKAIHNRGGKVVFVNFTKPPESSWGDVIDYWVQWDCDAWVSDLQTRVPKLWEAPPPPKKKKTEEEKEKEKRERPPPANPVALRDTRLTGAYWTLKIRDDLHKITGTPSLLWRAYEPTKEQSSGDSKLSVDLQADGPAETSLVIVQETIAVQSEISVSLGTAQVQVPTETTVDAAEKPNFAQKVVKAKPRRARKSAPGALERPKKKPSTLNPAHGRPAKPQPLLPAATIATVPGQQPSLPPREARTSISSILNSVKENPRIRKRKKIDGEEVILPGRRPRKSDTEVLRMEETCITLAPITNTQPPTPPQLDFRPRPLEPASPPAGPVAKLSAGLANAFQKGQRLAVHFQGILNRTYEWSGPQGHSVYHQREQLAQLERSFTSSDRDVAMALAQMRTPGNFMNMR